MRIVFFSFVTNFGGAARSEVWLARRLKKEGYEPVFVEPYGSSEQYRDAIFDAGFQHEVLTPHPRGKTIGSKGVGRALKMVMAVPDLMRIRAKAKQAIDRIKPDLICCQDFKAASIIGSLPGSSRIPLVMYLREWYTPDMLPFVSKRIWNKKCAGLIAVSHATRAAVFCSGIPWNKIHVLQNPIDIADQQALAERPLSGPLPGADRPIKLLLPAFIQERKQQHVAVEAARELQKRGIDFTLWMAGGVGIPDKRFHTYYHQCKQRTVELGLEDRVFWLDYRDDIPQLMRQADIVLQPSRREGHPRVMLESMSLSKPYVAAPIAGHIEMVLHKFTGMLHNLGDPVEMADAVVWLSEHPEEAQAIGQNGYRLVETAHRPEDHTQQAIAIFNKIAG